MKAVIFEEYGKPDVLKIQDIAKPTIGSQDILVRVKVASVTTADSRIRGARFPRGFGFLARMVFGITKPRKHILGSTYSGVVESVGKNVTDYTVGDEVCGMTGAKMGTYAELITVDTFKSIAMKPKVVSHEDAAGMLFGGTAALYFLRDKAKLQAGERVCINGASGAVGTNAVQLAKHFGATVVGVTSGENRKLVEELGADEVIDYTQTSLQDSGQTFDVVLDTVGSLAPHHADALLTQKGRLLLMVASLGQILKSRGRVMTGTATEKKADIEYLLALMEQGVLRTVIDATYRFDDIVKAHKHVDTGRKTGNVVVKL